MDIVGIEIKIDDNFRERNVGKWVEDFEAFSTKQWADFDFKIEQRLNQLSTSLNKI